MKQFFAELFIWWHGQTMGMRLRTWLRGKYVGSDEFGNRYFKDKKLPKRWVLYNGPAEASTIPPGWHGWIHHKVDTPPVDEHYQPWDWQKPHQANMTGSAAAYRPDGSLLNKGARPKVSADYDAWSPE